MSRGQHGVLRAAISQAQVTVWILGDVGYQVAGQSVLRRESREAIVVEAKHTRSAGRKPDLPGPVLEDRHHWCVGEALPAAKGSEGLAVEPTRPRPRTEPQVAVCGQA